MSHRTHVARYPHLPMQPLHTTNNQHVAYPTAGSPAPQDRPATNGWPVTQGRRASRGLPPTHSTLPTHGPGKPPTGLARKPCHQPLTALASRTWPTSHTRTWPTTHGLPATHGPPATRGTDQPHTTDLASRTPRTWTATQGPPATHEPGRPNRAHQPHVAHQTYTDLASHAPRTCPHNTDLARRAPRTCPHNTALSSHTLRSWPHHGPGQTHRAHQRNRAHHPQMAGQPHTELTGQPQRTWPA